MRTLHCLGLFALLSHTLFATGTEVLFDGRNLDQFAQTGDANWEIVGGTVRADRGKGMLVTKKSYKNYRLTLEFYPEKKSNSGVFLRCKNARDINDKNCYEANIFDSRPDPSGRTGAIVNIAKPLVHIDSEEQWNSYDITVQGSRLLVKLNGKTTVDSFDGRHVEGPIGLQYAMGGIRFRNVKITPLKDSLDIRGVWDLTEFTLDDGKGSVLPWCEGAHGVIIYTKGYMSVAINCDSKPEKMVHYSGPFIIDGKSVVHQVKNFSDPKLKQNFRRTIAMPSPDRLDLIGPFGENGKAIVSWKRR